MARALGNRLLLAVVGHAVGCNKLFGLCIDRKVLCRRSECRRIFPDELLDAQRDVPS